MLELAIADHRAAGFDAALLFSDIGGEYYERLGFRPVRSDECTAEAADLPRGGAGELARGDEASLARVFTQSRSADGELSLARDGWVLSFQLRRLRELARARGAGEPEWALRIASGVGEAAAMLRVSRDAIEVLDAGWTSESLRDRLLAALRLWPAHQLRGLFPAEPRSSALGMVAPLRDGVKLPAAGAAAAFALLDHI